MVRLRAGQGRRDRRDHPPTWRSTTRAGDADVLVLGWGSTYGPIARGGPAGAQHRQPVAQAHLRHLNPFPANTGEVLARYERVVVPEMNLGQLSLLLRAKYLVDVQSAHPGARAAVHRDELADVLQQAVASPPSASPTGVSR